VGLQPEAAQRTHPRESSSRSLASSWVRT
jgi:hypothetical protein